MADAVGSNPTLFGGAGSTPVLGTMVKTVRCPADDTVMAYVISEHEMRVMHIVNLFGFVRRPGGWQ